MHPADQFEAFRRLADEKGWGAEEIGARFGVSAGGSGEQGGASATEDGYSFAAE